MLYTLYGYTEKDKETLKTLVMKANKIGVSWKNVDEFLFQFSPRLVDEKTDKFNEHEPWINFHKHALYSAIVEKMIEIFVKHEGLTEYDSEDLYSYYLDNEEEFIKYIDTIDFTEIAFVLSFMGYVWSQL